MTASGFTEPVGERKLNKPVKLIEKRIDYLPGIQILNITAMHRRMVIKNCFREK